MSISIVNTVVNTSSEFSIAAFPAPRVEEARDAHPRPSSFEGSIMHSTTAFARMVKRMNVSKRELSLTRMHNERRGFVRDRVPKHVVGAYFLFSFVFVAASSPPAAARLRLARRARRYDLNDDLGGGGSRPFAETPAAPRSVSAPSSFAVSVFTGGNGPRNNRAIRLCCAASSADRSPAAGSTVPLTRSIRDPRPRPRPARHPVSARDGPGAPSTEGSRGRRKEAIATGDPTNANYPGGTARFSSRSAHGEPNPGGAATRARDPRNPRRADRSRRAKCATRVRRATVVEIAVGLRTTHR